MPLLEPLLGLDVGGVLVPGVVVGEVGVGGRPLGGGRGRGGRCGRCGGGRGFLLWKVNGHLNVSEGVLATGGHMVRSHTQLSKHS